MTPHYFNDPETKVRCLTWSPSHTSQGDFSEGKVPRRKTPGFLFNKVYLSLGFFMCTPIFRAHWCVPVLLEVSFFEEDLVRE